MNLRLRALLTAACAPILLGAPVVHASVPAGQLALERNDYDAALREFTAAAQAGNAEGQYELGYLYLLGRGGIQRDPRQAATWFGRAADQGHPEAQMRLADLTAQGLGVPQDYERARQLLRAALPRLRDAEKRYAESYAVMIDQYLLARATQVAAPAPRPGAPPARTRPERPGATGASAPAPQQGARPR